MKAVVSSPQKRRSIRIARTVLFPLCGLLLVLSSACTLTLEVVHYRPVYFSYTCKTVLMDTSFGRASLVNRSTISTDARCGSAIIGLFPTAAMPGGC